MRSSAPILRLNCGADVAFIDPDGGIWAADDGRGAARRIGGQTARRPDILPIEPPGWAGLLRHEAYGMAAYRLDLPAGVYAVRLLVAETFPAMSALERTYEVRLAGVVVARICPYRIAGGFARPGEVRLRGVRVGTGGLELGFGPAANLVGLEISADIADVAPAVACAAWLPSPAAAPSEPVLRRTSLRFVGNSGSFYWAMPETVAYLVARHLPGQRLDTTAFYAGGKDAAFFRDAPGAAAVITAERGGLVSIQDSSGGPLDAPEASTAGLDGLIAQVRAAGSEPVLYAYSGPLRHDPGQRRRIQAHYDAIGARHGVAVVPCAAALAQAQEELPGVDFHDPDGVHLGIAGGTLYACCWYRMLAGPAAPPVRDRSVLGGRIALPDALSARLAAIADRVCAGRGAGLLMAAS